MTEKSFSRADALVFIGWLLLMPLLFWWNGKSPLDNSPSLEGLPGIFFFLFFSFIFVSSFIFLSIILYRVMVGLDEDDPAMGMGAKDNRKDWWEHG